MKVLSLFDGISCGLLALNKCGIKVDEYFASEIEPNAISVAQKTILLLLKSAIFLKYPTKTAFFIHLIKITMLDT